jgi:hypothetical protein
MSKNSAFSICCRLQQDKITSENLTYLFAVEKGSTLLRHRSPD